MIKEEKLLGSNKVIVGKSTSDLVLETLGKVYIKSGKNMKLLNNLFKLIDSTPENVCKTISTEAELQSITFPGDGVFVFAIDTKTLYIAYNKSYIKLGEEITSEGYVKRSGDIMSGQLTINTKDAPLVVTSNTLVKNLNAEYLNGYKSDVFTKRNTNENINGNWTFHGNNTVTGDWTFKNPLVKYSGSLVSTGGFASGFSGYGWKLDSATNTLTIDNLIVRKAMNVYELVVNKIRATNGSIWVSDGAKIEKVTKLVDSLTSGSISVTLPKTDHSSNITTNTTYTSIRYNYNGEEIYENISNYINDLTLFPFFNTKQEYWNITDSVARNTQTDYLYWDLFLGDFYEITLDDENVKYCPFRTGDLLRCQKYTNNLVKYYDAIVTNVLSDKIIIRLSSIINDKYETELPSESTYDSSNLTINKLSDPNRQPNSPEVLYSDEHILAQPQEKDSLVRIGNIFNTNRQGSIYITSSDDQAPYIDILDQIVRPDYNINRYIYNSATTTGDWFKSNKTRLGKLNGIYDPAFDSQDQPTGYGLYSENVYLTGRLIVKNNTNSSGYILGEYRGEWVINTQYYLHDTVTYNGSTYTALQGHISTSENTPDNTSYWKLYIKKGDNGEQGKTGPSLSYRGNYDSVKTYTINNNNRNVIKYNTTYYMSFITEEHTSAMDQFLTESNGVYTINAGSMPAGIGSVWITFQGNFESVATNLLLAENASFNIANTNTLYIGDYNSGTSGWLLNGYGFSTANYIEGTSGANYTFSDGISKYVFANSGSKYFLNVNSNTPTSQALISTPAFSLYKDKAFFKGDIYSATSGEYATTDDLISLISYMSIVDKVNPTRFPNYSGLEKVIKPNLQFSKLSSEVLIIPSVIPINSAVQDDEVALFIGEGGFTSTSGGSGGTDNYNLLANKPYINGVQISSLNADSPGQNYISTLYSSDGSSSLAMTSIAQIDNTGKVLASMLPDYLLGQVLYGGNINGSSIATLTQKFKSKYGISTNTLTITSSNASTYEGVYFISTADAVSGIVFNLGVKTGDWVLSNGVNWTKVDNTDAVTGIKGDAENDYRIGNVNITYSNLGVNSIAYGGTGLSTIPLGKLLIGNGANAITTNNNIYVSNSVLHSDLGIYTKYINLPASPDNIPLPNSDTVVLYTGSGGFTSVSGGSGGTDNYNDLSNKPTINTYDIKDITIIGGTDVTVDTEYNTTTKVTTLTINNNYGYTLPIASATALGGIKVGSNLNINNGVLSGNAGTVTSVALSVPTGLTVTNSPITTSGTLAVAFASGYSIPTTANQDNWTDGYSHSQIINGANPHGTTFANIANKPTTISGYGITNAYTKTEIDSTVSTINTNISSNTTNISTIQGYFLNGIAKEASKITNSLVLKFNGGAVENTSLYTFNGSAAKTINIVSGNKIGFTIAAGSITINHSSITAPTLDNNKVINGITVDTYGHTTAITGLSYSASATANTLPLRGASGELRNSYLILNTGQTPSGLSSNEIGLFIGSGGFTSVSGGSGGSGGVSTWSELANKPKYNSTTSIPDNANLDDRYFKDGSYLFSGDTGSMIMELTRGLTFNGNNGIITSIDGQAESLTITHSTLTGYKHIPSGGSTGQILKYSEEGTAVWSSEYSYTLPLATTNSLGGIKIGYSSSGKNYAVQLSSEKAYVSVPWTDTTYSAGTGISLSGTVINNSGVRSIATGTANGTISVNTNGTTANVSVYGLGSNAYTSTAYVPTTRTIAGLVLSSDIGVSSLQSALGLGSNAYTSTAYLPLTGGIVENGNICINTSAGTYGLQLWDEDNNVSALMTSVNNVLKWNSNNILHAGNYTSYAVPTTRTIAGLALSANIGVSSLQSALGLGTAAYTASTSYAAASHTHSYLPLSGGTMTGTIHWSNSFNDWTANYEGLVILRLNTATGQKGYWVGLSVKNYYGFQLASYGGNNNTLQYRSTGVGTTGPFADWVTILHSSNYTSYVSKIGTDTLGSATQPVYLNAGVPTACTSYANASVNYASSSGVASFLLTGFSYASVPNNSYDVNTLFNNYPQTMFSQYDSSEYWVNAPYGMGYGTVLNLHNNYGNSGTLDAQLAWDINHNSTSSTRKLWFRAKNNLGWQNDWKEIYHTGNFNPANYLPLSGGTMTGNLGIIETKNILLRLNNANYHSGIGYDTSGNECIALWAKNTVTRLRWHAGLDLTNLSSGSMMSITPDFEISKASGIATGYIDGKVILHSGNYNSYSPTLTGSGASGTWGINITGNASTATNLSRSILAGNGLTGGGALNADRTLTLGTPSNITATSTNSVTASSHTHNLVMGAGSGLDADLLDGLQKTSFAQEYNYLTYAQNSGWYKIKILSTASWMLCFTIRVYQNYDYYDIVVSGYQYGSSYWYSPKAKIITGSQNSVDVKFGHDSVNNLWVAIPAGDYTGLKICNITNGYRQVSDWSTEFSITNEATLSGTVDSSIIAKRPLVYDENAASATKLQTTRSIWGQSFDGTGNVSGAMTGVSTISASGNITTGGKFYDSSDIRLKNIKSNLNCTLEDIRNIPKVLFNWNSHSKNEGKDLTKTYIGTIAQRLPLSVKDYLINEDTDGYLSVDYDSLGVIALKGIDLLDDKTTQLENRIKYLEDKNRFLENEIKRLGGNI